MEHPIDASITSFNSPYNAHSSGTNNSIYAKCGKWSVFPDPVTFLSYAMTSCNFMAVVSDVVDDAYMSDIDKQTVNPIKIEDVY